MAFGVLLIEAGVRIGQRPARKPWIIRIGIRAGLFEDAGKVDTGQKVKRRRLFLDRAVAEDRIKDIIATLLQAVDR